MQLFENKSDFNGNPTHELFYNKWRKLEKL